MLFSVKIESAQNIQKRIRSKFRLRRRNVSLRLNENEDVAGVSNFTFNLIGFDWPILIDWSVI